jgi:hypothetical protein
MPCFAAFAFRLFNAPLAVNYSCDGHLSGPDPIHDPIAVCDQLAQIFIVELRHLASGKGKLLEGASEGEDSPNH